MKKKQIEFTRFAGGATNFFIENILWGEYGKAISREKFPLDVAFFFQHERRLFRKKKLYLCLVSSCPGSLIGRAGENINRVTEKIKKQYPFIDDIKIIESTAVVADPMSFRADYDPL